MSDGEKKTLTDSCAQSDPTQAAYFHMWSVLMKWKQKLLFDPLAKPNPTSAPEIIATRVFSFVERYAEIESFKKRFLENRISRKKSETNDQEERRQLIDSTQLTNSLPLTFKYLTATQEISCCQHSCVYGHAIKVSPISFMVYLKDQRPPFHVDLNRLMNPNICDIRRPELIMSSEEKVKMNRRLLRESKCQQETINKMRKEQAEIARKQWMLTEYKNMVMQIQENKHTFQDFTGLLDKFSQPFEHQSKDGYFTTCTSNESTCITEMVLQAIGGVLCQKRQAEEITQINALQKKRKSSKRKWTPNTTRGDDGIGIYM